MTKVKDYWDDPRIESMYDKHLLNLEIELISSYIPDKSVILDAGCGEGEGTLVYSVNPANTVHAVDFSGTRLDMARKRLAGAKNVIFEQVDFLKDTVRHNTYDIVISQRMLINIIDWELQKRIIRNLMNSLKLGGRLLMLEGSMKGVRELNEVRAAFDLKPIPVKWHNLFFEDNDLDNFMRSEGHKFLKKGGFGEYFVLTRAVRPYFDSELNWDCDFNMAAASNRMRIMGLNNQCSRLKLWVWEKQYVSCPKCGKKAVFVEEFDSYGCLSCAYKFKI